jgi:predicted nucleic acid-binding protein
MLVTVLDASVVVDYLLGLSPELNLPREIEKARDIAFPALLEIEALSAIGKILRQGRISRQRARAAIQDLSLFPAKRYEHTPLLPRIFELQSNFSACDATYLALTEALRGSLLTMDQAFRHYRGKAKVRLIA